MKSKQNKTYTSADFAKWGAVGGAKVKGDAKRQSKAHYARIAQLGVEARRAKALQSEAKKN